MRKEKEELTERMGREPTVEELATSLGRKKKNLSRQWRRQRGRVDLQADPSGGRFATEHSGQAGRKKQTGRTSSEPDDAVSDFRRTGQGGTTVIYLRYFQEKTQAAVGEILGISQVQVSRMEKKILERMRKQM